MGGHVEVLKVLFEFKADLDIGVSYIPLYSELLKTAVQLSTICCGSYGLSSGANCMWLC